MRIKHRVHLPKTPTPVTLDPAYQAEVDRSTERLERRYRLAQRRAEQAQQRLHAAERETRKRSNRNEMAQLHREVEARLAELAELDRLMKTSPASATHRGTEGWTKVPR